MVEGPFAALPSESRETSRISPDSRSLRKTSSVPLESFSAQSSSSLRKTTHRPFALADGANESAEALRARPSMVAIDAMTSQSVKSAGGFRASHEFDADEFITSNNSNEKITFDIFTGQP